MGFWNIWIQDPHECMEKCNGQNGHFGSGSYTTIIHLESRIQLEFGHLVIYLNRTTFFCFHCSLFNPRILYYELRQRIS